VAFPVVKSSFSDDLSTLTLDDLNTAIHWAKFGWENGGTSQGRRAFFKKLIALEAEREARFDIQAPKRRYNR
jgi:hypothetical protein